VTDHLRRSGESRRGRGAPARRGHRQYRLHKLYEDSEDYFCRAPGFVPSAGEWFVEKGEGGRA
jgi:hypothetical protein